MLVIVEMRPICQYSLPTRLGYLEMAVMLSWLPLFSEHSVRLEVNAIRIDSHSMIPPFTMAAEHASKASTSFRTKSIDANTASPSQPG